MAFAVRLPGCQNAPGRSMSRAKPLPFRPHLYASYAVGTGAIASDRALLFGWTGTHWAPHDEREAKRVAYLWLVSQNANWASDDNATKAYRAACLFAPALPMLTRRVVIPARNGYVHLEGTELVLRPADPQLGLAHALACDFVPEGPSPDKFLAFLAMVLPDAAVRSRVQEYVGYTLTPDARHQRAQFWLGEGANGKGVLVNIVQALHGRIAAMSLDKLVGFHLSALVGASLIVVDEVARKSVDEQLLKSMIAGERTLVDRKFRDPVSVHVRGKWLVLGNQLPVITDHSVGFWRRWDVVPFSVVIPERARDPLLAQAIIASELAGVLVWALQGLVRLQQRGCFDPAMPAAMTAMLHDVKAETNSVLAWMDDCEVRTLPACTTSKERVFEHYRAWCSAGAMQEVNVVQFWKRMNSHLPDLAETRMRLAGQQRRMCNVGLGGAGPV